MTRDHLPGMEQASSEQLIAYQFAAPTQHRQAPEKVTSSSKLLGIAVSQPQLSVSRVGLLPSPLPLAAHLHFLLCIWIASHSHLSFCILLPLLLYHRLQSAPRSGLNLGSFYFHVPLLKSTSEGQHLPDLRSIDLQKPLCHIRLRSST